MKPLISVLIRTYNSWSTTRTIVAALDDPRIERVLVDSGSHDLPADIERLVEKIVRYEQKPFSYGGSLNAGVAVASADWTWVLSSHCLPIQPEVAEKIIALLGAVPPEIVCVLGATLPPGRQLEIAPGERACTLVHGSDFPGGNPNCLYRNASLRARPFDELLLTCEDTEWFLAAKNAGKFIGFSRSFPVRYCTQRPVSVIFRKGLDEYRVGKCLGKPRAKIGFSIIKRLARNLAKVLLGRLNWDDCLRKEAYFFGWFWAENFLPAFTEADLRRRSV